MEPKPMPPLFGNDASRMGRTPTVSDDVVEIGLLLSSRRAEALLALSRQRHQTVGHIIRGLIDQAIATAEA